MNIGIALKRIRDALAITQTELSSLTGLSVAMISYMENGSREPSKETVQNLMTVLMLSQEQLELVAIEDLSVFEERYQRLAALTQCGILETIASQYRARKELGVAV